MAYSERKRLLTAFIEEVWSQGRIEACDDFVGATYTVRHDPGDPWDGQTLSLSGLKERVRVSRGPFPDQRFTLETILEDGKAVAIAWTWAASLKGDIAGLSATGARITMSGLTIYDFDEANRICGHWQVADPVSSFQECGRNTAHR